MLGHFETSGETVTDYYDNLIPYILDYQVLEGALSKQCIKTKEWDSILDCYIPLNIESSLERVKYDIEVLELCAILLNKNEEYKKVCVIT